MSSEMPRNKTRRSRWPATIIAITAATLAASAARPGHAAAADPCTLVTAAEVASLIPGAKPTPSSDESNGAHTTICGWAVPGSSLPTLEVRVSPDSAALKTGLGANRDYLKMVFRSEAEENSGRYVADLGDVAKVESVIAMSAEATVVLGTTMLIVEYTGQGAKEKQEQVLGLARQAVKRLQGAK